MISAGWLLTYALPIGLLAFGTVTQGDDDPWRLSLFFFAPLTAIGLAILWSHRFQVRNLRWMGAIHIATLILAIRILPGYWSRVTLHRDHIGAGFDADYAGAFEPAPWHPLWAPVMTGLCLAVAFVSIRAFTQTKAEQVTGADR